MPNFASSLLAAALVAGAAIPFQAGANAMLGRLLGHPLWATMVSLAVSVALAVPVMLAFKVPAPSFATAAATGPWWIWIGGAAGVVYVTAALLLAPKMGSASFVVAVIGGQMVTSLVIDHLGLVGFLQRPASLARVAGLVLIVIGPVVTQWASAAKGRLGSPQGERP